MYVYYNNYKFFEMCCYCGLHANSFLLCQYYLTSWNPAMCLLYTRCELVNKSAIHACPMVALLSKVDMQIVLFSKAVPDFKALA